MAVTDSAPVTVPAPADREPRGAAAHERAVHEGILRRQSARESAAACPASSLRHWQAVSTPAKSFRFSNCWFSALCHPKPSLSN